jgi:uncharacterized protein (DUF1697 family)
MARHVVLLRGINLVRARGRLAATSRNWSTVTTLLAMAHDTTDR